MCDFEFLDGLNDGGGEESRRIVDSRELFECIEEHGGAGTEKLGGLARKDRAVLQLKRNGGSVGFTRAASSSASLASYSASSSSFWSIRSSCT